MLHTKEQKGQSFGLPGLTGVDPNESNNKGTDELVLREEPIKTDAEIEHLYAAAEHKRLGNNSLLVNVLNISNILTDGASAMVDDSFNKCFTSMNPEPWNWNVYLYFCWILGVFIRYFVLFPLRSTILFICFTSLVGLFLIVDVFAPRQRRAHIERKLVQLMCSAWVMAWHGVIRYHGPKPIPGPNRVWVSNHTSMIDYVVLCSYAPFAVIMQLHHGWIAFLQKRVLSSLGCLWFNRTEVQDRHVVAARMRAHVQQPDPTPLLIFPEGTCVNNEYTVMFKRGAFDLGATVCPVAIKYNKIFVDAFWNSRREAFGRHLFRLLTSWALVCDVYFLEPQTMGPNETPQEFAGRVQQMIAKYANLRIVPWDGYLKYYNLGKKHPGLIEKRRKVFADALRRHLRGKDEASEDKKMEEEEEELGGNQKSDIAAPSPPSTAPSPSSSPSSPAVEGEGVAEALSTEGKKEQ